jgi:hypothetical protein
MTNTSHQVWSRFGSLGGGPSWGCISDAQFINHHSKSQRIARPSAPPMTIAHEDIRLLGGSLSRAIPSWVVI